MKRLGVFLVAVAAALAMSGCAVSKENSRVITDNNQATGLKPTPLPAGMSKRRKLARLSPGTIGRSR